MVKNEFKKLEKFLKICRVLLLISIVGLVLMLTLRTLYYFIYQHKINTINQQPNKKPENLTNCIEIISNQQDYRFSLKISHNQYFHYNGEKVWIFKNKTIKLKFNETERNNNIIIISALNEKIQLPSLCINYLHWNETSWQNVWGSSNGETIFYPINENKWFEVHNDIHHATHEFKNKSDEKVILKKYSDGFNLELNNTGMFGGFSDHELKLINSGKWIHFS